eukprot:8713722-Pyramimonas_sp.AAC.1
MCIRDRLPCDPSTGDHHVPPWYAHVGVGAWLVRRAWVVAKMMCRVGHRKHTGQQASRGVDREMVA